MGLYISIFFFFYRGFSYKEHCIFSLKTVKEKILKNITNK